MNSLSLLLLLLTGLVVGVPFLDCASVRAASVVLEPVADTELRENSPTSVVSGDRLVAGGLGVNANNETRRALLRFDLAAIPAEAVVRSVQLDFTVVQVPQNSANSTFELRRILADWNELETSWQRRRTGIDWGSAGALGTSDAAALASGTFPVTAAPGAVEVTSAAALVADVQAWIANPASNHGWLLRSQSEATLRTARQFASRAAVDTGSRPKLTVDYVLPAVIEQPAITGDEFTFQFTAAAGVTYVVEQREAVDAGLWENVQTVGPFAQEQLALVRRPWAPGGAPAFFRVIIQ